MATSQVVVRNEGNESRKALITVTEIEQVLNKWLLLFIFPATLVMAITS